MTQRCVHTKASDSDIEWQCVTLRCSILQYVAVRCSTLQCVAVCCSMLFCCSMLQCVANWHWDACTTWCPTATVGRRLLQCVAVCCSVLQYVAVCLSIFLLSLCRWANNNTARLRKIKYKDPPPCKLSPTCTTCALVFYTIPWPHYQKIKKWKGSGERGWW